MSSNPSRSRALSLDRQASLVRLHYPGFKARFENHKLVINGVIRPTQMSSEYQVRIEYAWCRMPGVYVVTPALVTNRFGDDIPHRHTDVGRPLCLCYGKARDWSPREPLSMTTIPWAAEWLFFYEVWHATGHWLGGGTEHAPLHVPSDVVEHAA